MSAAEVDDLKRELSIIQLKISEEEARYQAAKAQMERAQIVAQYLFPDLKARERQLVEKIEKLNGTRNEIVIFTSGSFWVSFLGDSA